MPKSLKRGTKKTLLLLYSVVFSIFVVACNSIPKLPSAQEIVDESIQTVKLLKQRTDLEAFSYRKYF